MIVLAYARIKGNFDYRCEGCEKLLFKGVLLNSEIEVKYKRCGQMNVFQGALTNNQLCMNAEHCPRRIAVAK